MTTTTRPYPQPAMYIGETIRAPRRAWHENPLLKLRFDVQRMSIHDAIEYNGWRVTKSWTPSEGNLWRAYREGEGVRVCTSARQAADVITAVSETETVADSGQLSIFAGENRTQGNS